MSVEMDDTIRGAGLRQGQDSAARIAASLVPGTLIDGKYRVVRLLGEGAMGVVLLAHDEDLSRDVAIKLVGGEWAGAQHVQDQFVVEAKAMAKVRHPNVVNVFAFGRYEGTPFFVMEYVPGHALDDWVESRGGPPVAVDEALGLIEQVCRGVDAIHQAGLLHGDLKPGNVLVGPAFRVAVADLGLARAMDQHGTWGGTPSFMAPEVAARVVVQPELAARIDVYAVAVMCFELLTGQSPFDGQTADEVMYQHIHAEPPLPSQVRPDLSPAFDLPIRRALAKDPGKRTASVMELRDQLLAARGRAAPDLAGPRLRIVVADDDGDFRDWLEAVLESGFPGAEILMAPDGDRALAVATKEPTDLAVIDLQMPGLNGLELTAALRQHEMTRRTPILVLTAVGGAPDWKLLQAMGADGFLIKPTEPVALIALARRLVAADDVG